MPILAALEGVFDGVLRGWALNENGGEPLDLSLLADGQFVGRCAADRFRSDLVQLGRGDGKHGFEYILPIELHDGAKHAFALHHGPEGSASAEIAAASFDVPYRTHLLRGNLERIVDQNLLGWIWDPLRPNASVPVEMLIDGKPRAKTVANRFRKDLVAAGIGHGSHGFVFDLSGLGGMLTQGCKLTVRTTADFGHWELGTLLVEDAPPAPVLAPVPKAPPPAKAEKPRPAAPPAARSAFLAAREAEQKRDFAKAIELLDAQLAHTPVDFDLVFLRARVALSIKDLAATEQFAKAALELRPGHPRAIVLLARVAFTRADHLSASEYWRRIGPDDEAYRERLIKHGRSLMALGRPLAAFNEFSKATRLGTEDTEALLATAEALEAAGAVRASLPRWRRYLAAVPGDTKAGGHVERLLKRFIPPGGLRSPLLNSHLRDWTGASPAQAGPGPAEISPGVLLSSLSEDGTTLTYAPAEPQEERPGELPRYGLWVHSREGAEVSFALDGAARENLIQGLRMAIAFRGPSGPASHAVPVRLLLRDATGMERDLVDFVADDKSRLIPFDLRLTPDEVDQTGQTTLQLVVRFQGGGSVILHPPRPFHLLLDEPDTACRFEDEFIADGLDFIKQSCRGNALHSQGSSPDPKIRTGKNGGTYQFITSAFKRALRQSP